MFSTWFLYIPDVKLSLGLDDMGVSAGLFCISLGGLVILPFNRYFISLIGPAKATTYFIIVFIICISIPAFAPSFLILCASLFLVGIFSSILNVSANALALSIEGLYRIKILSICHAFFSLGTFIGSGVGSAIRYAGISKQVHLVTLALVLVLANARGQSKPIIEVSPIPSPVKSRTSGLYRLYPAIIVIFFLMLGEGAIADWSGIFLVDMTSSKSTLAGFGYSFFSIGMCTGRFFGDNITRYFSSATIKVRGLILALFGLLILQTNIFIISLLGFLLTGIGFSTIAPLIFRDSTPNNADTTKELSTLSGAGSLGFMIGPLLFGAIAQWANLHYSFFFLALCIFLSIFLSKKIK